MSKIMKYFIIYGVLVMTGFHSAPATAAYPERAINYIVAYRVGGGSDRTSRAFVPFLEKHLGKGAKIAIINKPGAGGNIGFNAIANAKPDGYTIGMTNFPQAIVGPIMGKVKYTIKDFDFLGNVNRGPTTFAVLNTSKYKSLADLMADVKKNPGKISMGMAALSSVHSIGTSKFMVKTGLKLNKVPFGGGGPARNALAWRPRSGAGDFDVGHREIQGQGAHHRPGGARAGLHRLLGSDVQGAGRGHHQLRLSSRGRSQGRAGAHTGEAARRLQKGDRRPGIPESGEEAESCGGIHERAGDDESR